MAGNSGMQMMLKAMGFDPEVVLKTVNEIGTLVKNAEARLTELESLSKQILANQLTILEKLDGKSDSE